MSGDLLNMHECRLGQKPKSMEGFLLKESPLRNNPAWTTWLDAKHPSLEHVYFRDAMMGSFATSITVGTEFAAHYIRVNYGAELDRHFGSHVAITSRERKNLDGTYTQAAQDARYAKYQAEQAKLAVNRKPAAKIKADLFPTGEAEPE